MSRWGGRGINRRRFDGMRIEWKWKWEWRFERGWRSGKFVMCVGTRV